MSPGRRRILGDGSGHQEGYAMEEGIVVPLPRLGAALADDPLLAVLREGARPEARGRVDLPGGVPRPEALAGAAFLDILQAETDLD